MGEPFSALAPFEDVVSEAFRGPWPAKAAVFSVVVTTLAAFVRVRGFAARVNVSWYNGYTREPWSRGSRSTETAWRW